MSDNPFRVDSDGARHDIRWWAKDPGDVRAQVWSLIAAYAHGFSYNYDYLINFLRSRNDTCGWGGDPKYYHAAPIPTPLEYLGLLEFRASQLERAVVDISAEWSWPEQWGCVPLWNGPIVQPFRKEDCSLLDVHPSLAAILRLTETRQAIRVHQFLLAQPEQLPRWLLTLDRAQGLREIRDFTRAATKLVVIDPYAYAGESQRSHEYVCEFAKAAAIRPELKALHVIYSSRHGNTSSIRKGIADATSRTGTIFTDHDTDLIHDRIWIADRSRALVVGTSFGGLGSRAAFMLPLPSSDLAQLLAFLDERRLLRPMRRQRPPRREAT